MAYTSRIDKVKDGHYRIVINLGHDPITGTYKRKRKDVRGTKPEAEAVRQKMLEELENPQKPPSEQPLGEYLLYWVDTIAKPDLEKNTYQSYRWEILEPLHIQTFYSYKAQAGRQRRPV